MPRLAIHPSASLAELLRRRRKELGLSLREVERRTGEQGAVIPFTTLAKIERGKVEPGVRRLHQLLKLYNLPLPLAGDLLELEDLADEAPPETDLKALYEKGVDYWKSGQIRKGLAYLFALRQKTAENQEDRALRQKALLSMAISASGLGKYNLSRQIVEDLLLEPPERSLLVPTLLQAAVSWLRLGSVDVALGFLARAEQLVADDDPRWRASVFHQKATTLAAARQYNLAGAELDRAIAAYRLAGDVYGEGKALSVLNRIRKGQGDLEGALKAVRAARAFAEKHGLERLVLLRMLDEGLALLDLDRAKEALPLLKSALSKALASENRAAEFYAHYSLWKAYQALGDREGAEVELKAARYHVRFLDEASEEADEIRTLSNPYKPRRRSKE